MASNRKQERERLVKKIAEKRALLESRGDVKVKIPRVNLPECTTAPADLFTLPPELVRPIVASQFGDYKKKLAAKKRQGKFVVYTLDTLLFVLIENQMRKLTHN